MWVKNDKLVRFALIVTLAVISPARSWAVGPSLVLDALSFFYFEGTQDGSVLPLSSISMNMIQQSPTQWSVTIAPSALTFPPTMDPSGATIEWRLASAAIGTLNVTGSEATFVISAPLLAFLNGSTEGIPFPLMFTTETVTAAAGGTVATRQGARLDLASGYLQLVASGVDWTGGSQPQQNPFYVVLSGRIEGLPALLAAP